MTNVIDKSSVSHPLRIDTVTPIAGTGLIGLSFCPGKRVTNAMSGGNWYRDLDLDLRVIQAWGATVVVTLLEYWEFENMHVEELGSAVADFGMVWHWLQIPDGGIPDGELAQSWQAIKTKLMTRLASGEHLFIHCRGGLGRTGTLAAELLISLGDDVSTAMRKVRAARPGAIETRAQEEYLARFGFDVTAVGRHGRMGESA